MIRVENKLPQYKNSLYKALDDGFKMLATDILVKSRNVAPFKKGQLRSDSDTIRKGLAHWQIRYHKEYAGVQERGSRGGIRFRNYTTSGTGPHYLEKTGNEEYNNAISTLRKMAKRARA